MIKNRFETPYPDGCKGYHAVWDEVAGVYHCKVEAIAFIKSENLWLEMEREPDNQYDKNAIKVIGCSKELFGTKKRHIGYVPAEIARVIVEGGFENDVCLLLAQNEISDGDDPYVHVKYMFVGRSERKKEFEAKEKALRN